MPLKNHARTLMLLGLVGCGAASTFVPQALWAATEDSYQKVSDSKDVVKDKLYPKKGRLEIDVPSVGLILNQSYTNTILLHGGLSYFPKEGYGLGAELALGMNSDKSERECIETFYMDPNGSIGPECGAAGDPANDLNGTGGKYGPAYVPIREIKYMAMANYIWTPVYGKQLFMLSATNYFDLFFTMGGGIVASDFYPQQDVLLNGKKSRGDATIAAGSTTKDITAYGADPSETNSYGPDGRPAPQSQTNLMINLGIGQKFHFAKRFSVRTELRNFTLVGTPGGFENLFALWAGLGVRF